MYKFVIVSVIALVVFQGALARPKAKQAAAAPAEESQVDKLAGEARQIIQNVSQALEGKLPDAKQVSETLTQVSQTVANNVKDVMDKLTKLAEGQEGNIQNSLNSIKENLNTTTSKLEEAIGPEGTQKVKDMKSKLDETLNKFISEAQQLVKVAEPELEKVKKDVDAVANNLMNNVVEAAKKLQSDLKKSGEIK